MKERNHLGTSLYVSGKYVLGIFTLRHSDITTLQNLYNL